jgi:hypothetical protein
VLFDSSERQTEQRWLLYEWSIRWSLSCHDLGPTLWELSDISKCWIRCCIWITVMSPNKYFNQRRIVWLLTWYLRHRLQSESEAVFCAEQTQTYVASSSIRASWLFLSHILPNYAAWQTALDWNEQLYQSFKAEPIRTRNPSLPLLTNPYPVGASLWSESYMWIRWTKRYIVVAKGA